MQLLNSIKASYEEGLYILDGVLCNGGSSLCLSTSAHSLRVYDVRSAAFQFDICAHTAVITDVTSTPSQPNLLYSSQEDTGVMVTDLRQGKPVHFLTEMCSSGARCCSVAVSQSGEKLALAADGDVHFVDTRTWCSFTSLPELHNDEITRLRFTDDRTLCTASEDQLVNLVDVRPAVSEDDMILSVINCEEVVTKMTCFPEKGVVTLIGSCENAFIVPLDLVSNETKIRRENFQTYQVDFVLLGDTLTLVSGLKDDDGVVGPLVTTEFASCTVPSAAAAAGVSGEGISTQRVAFTTQRVSTLPFVHKELTRVALGFGNRLVTGGEDGVVAYWQKGASGGASGTPGACHDTASTGESNSSSARNAAQMKARVKTSTLEATGRKTHGPY